MHHADCIYRGEGWIIFLIRQIPELLRDFVPTFHGVAADKQHGYHHPHCYHHSHCCHCQCDYKGALARKFDLRLNCEMQLPDISFYMKHLLDGILTIS